MEERIKLIHYEQERKNAGELTSFGLETARKAQKFHESFPEYHMTPLRELGNLAKELGVASIHVKDESFRFGLNSFKVLGGSYCIGNYIAERLGLAMEEVSYKLLTEWKTRNRLGELTFVTATDGNHGRGIAWTANKLGQRCIVLMPKGSSAERLAHIRALGAEAFITAFNYDDTVRLAAKTAKEQGGVMVQDTAWEGYEKLPRWIMQGYTTMAYEAVLQLQGRIPTHIFLQAGVGAMAGAMAAFFSELYPGSQRPVITVVEPDKADCIYRTASAADGRLHKVSGSLATIMAGLACGEPCTIGWEILKRCGDNFVSMPDPVAARGMRILGNPLGSDPRVISGESGAAALGFVAEVLTQKRLAGLKKQLKLDENSRVLCFSTEGDTDRCNYRRIVWDGLWSDCEAKTDAPTMP